MDRARRAHYKLTSTVILSLGSSGENLGTLDLSGNMVRQVEQDLPIEDDSSHVANVGKLVEDMEGKMRNLLRMISNFSFGVMRTNWSRGGILWQSKGCCRRFKKYYNHSWYTDHANRSQA